MKPATATITLLLLVLLVPSAALPSGTVCLQCHGAQTGSLGEPVTLWKGSVHEANSVSCHGCHGGDPTDVAMAMSPERGFIGVPKESDIPDFCGRCHVGVREDYLESAHGRALGSGGPTCVTCHGSHRVVTATIELINRRDCTRCHEYGRAEEIKSALAATDGSIATLERTLADLRRIGVTTKETDGELFDLRNRFHRLFHSVDVDKVRAGTAAFRQELDRIKGRVDAIQLELNHRKLWGGAVVVLLLLGAVLALLIYRSYRRER